MDADLEPGGAGPRRRRRGLDPAPRRARRARRPHLRGAGRLGLAVHDPFRPGPATQGTFTLDGGPDGATATPGGDADLACGVSALSAAWLGGVRCTTLARAGLVEERRAGALARADALFASEPLPYPFTWF